MDWLNDGAVIRRRRGEADGEASFVITGLARSGTSMLARVLLAGGVFLGEAADDVVHEDVEIGAALSSGDRERLKALIAARNGQHAVWGFKRPHLHAVMRPEELRLLRNPCLLVSSRDPVAVAQRNVISELLPDRQAVEEAARAQTALLDFAYAADCPVMLASYEKAVTMREAFIDRVIGFCGLAEMASRREAMLAAIEPNREAYRQAARRQYEGVIDQISEGVLTGWAREIGVADPVRLVLHVDGEAVAWFTADVWRPDLQAAGIGSDGRHGFAVNARPFLDHPDSVVAVYVEGRIHTLRKSGMTFSQLTEGSSSSLHT